MLLRKISIVIIALFLTACSPNKNDQSKTQSPNSSVQLIHNAKENNNYSQIKQAIITKYKNQHPHRWGEALPGIYRHLNTNKKVIALTFDACGGPKGSGYDANIIHYLKKMHIPATLFINSRWIDSNYNTFTYLSRYPLFEIENHGHLHKPLSVTGRSAWGIHGTKNAGEVVDEVLLNYNKIKNITRRAPKYFRSGTAFYDDIAVNIVKDLGQNPVGYSVLGDAGATFNTEQVKHALLSAKPGSIVILHMNQPHGHTAQGLMAAVPELLKRGYTFVKLSEYPLKE